MTMLMKRPAVTRRTVESAIMTPAGLRVSLSGGMALSPDGRYAAIISTDVDGGTSRLWLRRLDSNSFRLLEGTDEASMPFWSPDSRRIGFFARGKVKAVDAEGGAISVVCDAPAGRGASWSPGGRIILAPTSLGALAVVGDDGGTPKTLTTLGPGHTSHRWPFFLADGKTFLFTAQDGSDKNSIWQGTLDEPDKARLALPASDVAAWIAPGIIVHGTRNGRLLAHRYDAKSAKAIGEPVTVAESFISFSLSRDGTLLLQRNPNLILSQLIWVNRSGKEEEVITQPDLYFSPALSPDQRRVAFDLSDAAMGMGDLWIHDLSRNAATRLTFQSMNESAPHWSSDGKRIVYYAGEANSGDLFEVGSGGTGEPQLLAADEREKRPTSVSRDGQWIFFNSAGGTGMDIGLWSATERRAKSWLATPFRESNATISSDGKWVAYQSDESGRWEIYVRAFPESDQKWLVSNGGGVMPVWRSDGRELFYLSNDQKMMSVAVTPGADLEAAAPAALFDAPLRTHPTRQYDVSRDGQRFLLNRRVESATIEPLTLIQNWDLKLPEE
jgi:eukaryotic-like serine/threonine-protein kinase